jgi:hypothetical protein
MNSTFTSWLCSFSKCIMSNRRGNFGCVADKSLRRTRRIVLSHFLKSTKQGINENSGLRETKILNTVLLCFTLPLLEDYNTLLSRESSMCWENTHYWPSCAVLPFPKVLRPSCMRSSGVLKSKIPNMTPSCFALPFLEKFRHAILMRRSGFLETKTLILSLLILFCRFSKSTTRYGYGNS